MGVLCREDACGDDTVYEPNKEPSSYHGHLGKDVDGSEVEHKVGQVAAFGHGPTLLTKRVGAFLVPTRSIMSR